jgi:hypothetical protein
MQVTPWVILGSTPHFNVYMVYMRNWPIPSMYFYEYKCCFHCVPPLVLRFDLAEQGTVQKVVTTSPNHCYCQTGLTQVLALVT